MVQVKIQSLGGPLEITSTSDWLIKTIGGPPNMEFSNTQGPLIKMIFVEISDFGSFNASGKNPITWATRDNFKFALAYQNNRWPTKNGVLQYSGTSHKNDFVRN